jgi:hypothetical protein
VWLDLHDMAFEANTFHNLAACLVDSARPQVGKQQLEQVVAAENEILSMQQICADRISALGGNVSDIVVSYVSQ